MRKTRERGQGRFSEMAGDQKGMVLFMVLMFVMLMTSTALFFATTLKRDMDLIGRAKYAEQARNIAEAGLAHARARTIHEGFSAADINGTLDTGSYSVTFTEGAVVDGKTRYLILSTGELDNSDVTKSLSTEIRVPVSSATDYYMAAGNNVRIAGFLSASAINGDVYANNRVYIKAPLSIVSVSGNVYGKDYVMEGSRLHQRDGPWGLWLDALVFINGTNDDGATVYEGDQAPLVTFPTFDYESYKQAAIDGGSYYDSDTTFGAGGVSGVLTPEAGIVYVRGTATFIGDCELDGGIIADNIYIGREEANGSITQGSLTQTKTDDNMNVIVAKGGDIIGGDIGIYGQFEVDEAVVYAAQDVISLEAGAWITVSGSLMAGRDINAWSFAAVVIYTHVSTSPRYMDVGVEI